MSSPQFYSSTIQVKGLTEFRKSLKDLNSQFPRELAKINQDVAKDVADAAQSAAQNLGGVAAKSAPAISAVRSQVVSAVKLNGAAYPYALGAEFGSVKYKQFKAWRGNGSDAGYFLFPTIRKKVDDGSIINKYADAIDKLAKSAFPQ